MATLDTLRLTDQRFKKRFGNLPQNVQTGLTEALGSRNLRGDELSALTSDPFGFASRNQFKPATAPAPAPAPDPTLNKPAPTLSNITPPGNFQELLALARTPQGAELARLNPAGTTAEQNALAARERGFEDFTKFAQTPQGQQLAQTNPAGVGPRLAPTTPTPDVPPASGPNLDDFPEFKLTFKKKAGEPGFNASLDLNSDGTIDMQDVLLFTQGKTRDTSGGGFTGTQTTTDQNVVVDDDTPKNQNTPPPQEPNDDGSVNVVPFRPKLTGNLPSEGVQTSIDRPPVLSTLEQQLTSQLNIPIEETATFQSGLADLKKSQDERRAQRFEELKRLGIGRDDGERMDLVDELSEVENRELLNLKANAEATRRAGIQQALQLGNLQGGLASRETGFGLQGAGLSLTEANIFGGTPERTATFSDFAQSFNSRAGDPNYREDLDFDRNGVIDFQDQVEFQNRNATGQVTTAPARETLQARQGDRRLDLTEEEIETINQFRRDKFDFEQQQAMFGGLLELARNLGFLDYFQRKNPNPFDKREDDSRLPPVPGTPGSGTPGDPFGPGQFMPGADLPSNFTFPSIEQIATGPASINFENFALDSVQDGRIANYTGPSGETFSVEYNPDGTTDWSLTERNGQTFRGGINEDGTATGFGGEFHSQIKKTYQLGAADFAVRLLMEGDLDLESIGESAGKALGDVTKGTGAQIIASFLPGPPLVTNIIASAVLQKIENGEFLGLGDSRGRQIIEKMRTNPESVTQEDMTLLRNSRYHASGTGQSPETVEPGSRAWRDGFSQYPRDNEFWGPIEAAYRKSLLDQWQGILNKDRAVFDYLKEQKGDTAMSNMAILEAIDRAGGDTARAIDILRNGRYLSDDVAEEAKTRL